VDDRPVIFVFERAQESLSDNEWKYVLKRYRDNYGKRLFVIGDRYEIDRLEYFDGMHCYFPYVGNLEELKVYYSLFSNYCDYKGKLFTATVCPGLEDWRHIYGFSYDRDRGSFYKALWDISIEEKADWIAITSFNEWHEGTEIEPSIEFGRKYLEFTDEFSKKFKR
jgi:hypothetical protein